MAAIYVLVPLPASRRVYDLTWMAPGFFNHLAKTKHNTVLTAKIDVDHLEHST